MELIMKIDSFRNIVATASLAAGLAGVSSAQADVVTGSLGAGASATDRYHVTCPDNTSRLKGNVTDLVPVAAPLVSMVIRTRKGATHTTDPIDGFEPFAGPFQVAGTITNPSSRIPALLQLPSPTVSLFGGLGVYEVLIVKSAAGVENYRMNVQCFGGIWAGGTLPTTIVQVQNQ
jgi:hypothetical protein